MVDLTIFSEMALYTKNLGKNFLSPFLGMICGPCAGYIIQCYTMVYYRTSEGFSPYVSLILLIANIIRLFWLYICIPNMS